MRNRTLFDIQRQARQFEGPSGICVKHIEAVAKVCMERNLFLFVRPTEAASTRLIKAGFATKSMDIHHKSSNWGPMAGAVPVDPAWNKNLGKDGDETWPPQPNPTEVKGNEAHGAALHVRLSLSTDLLNELIQDADTDLWLDKGATRMPLSSQVPVPLFSKRRPKKQGPSVWDGAFSAVPGQANTWDIKWVDTSNVAHDLWVWGYKVADKPTPVTGDYDLWMVAPHASWWKLHTQVLRVEDEHDASAATLFTTWLLGELNRACDRADSPVFQHGAEQQNYGFTQPIDEKLAMFTPSGHFEMIFTDPSKAGAPQKRGAPEVLAQLARSLYLVPLNAAYFDTVSERQVSGKHESKVRGNSAAESQHLKARIAMSKLRRDFKAALKDKVAPLEPEECFGAWYAYTPEGQLDALMELQNKVVQAVFRGGESNLETVEGWMEQNPALVQALGASLPPAPGAEPQIFDRNTKVPFGADWDKTKKNRAVLMLKGVNKEHRPHEPGEDPPLTSRPFKPFP
ncbi:anthrax toxin-like adenylyl cyclase domain-containing protein [Melittangium boletus]|uniref:anthrax toxin-like adenylyl cyclase domain-containing protein n=1 Tax=Melittangium boletus TaxID=83453 RepID=UPI003DA655A5